MGDLPERQRLRVWWLLSLAVLALVTTAAAAYLYVGRAALSEIHVAPSLPARSYLSRVKVEYFCSRCHAYPPADTLPRSAWREEVDQAYRFFVQSHLPMQAPPIEDVIHYYEDSAPPALPVPGTLRATSPPPPSFPQM